MDVRHALLPVTRETEKRSRGETAEKPLGREWLFVVTVLLFLAISALRLFLMVRGSPVDSDNTLPMILAQSLRTGLTHGWFFAPDNFLLSDFPFYLALSFLFGTTATTIWVATVVVSALSLLLIIFAVNRAIGQIEALILTIICTFPFILGKATFTILSTPFIHLLTIGFGIWLASVIITKSFDSLSISWPTLAVLTILASFVETSDPLFLFVFAIPLLAVGIWYFVSDRKKKAALWTSIAIINAVNIISLLERMVIAHAGNTVWSAGGKLLPYRYLAFHLELLVQAVSNLLGANFTGLRIGPLFVLDLVKLGIIGYFLLHTVNKYRAWRLDTPRRAFVAYAVIMGIIVVCAFVFSNQAVDIYGQRYLTPAVFGAVILVSAGVADKFCRFKKGLIVALFLSAICTGATMVKGQPEVQQSPYIKIAQELQSRHIQYGYSGYWHASAVTFASDQRVRIRAVLPAGDDRALPYDWLANRQWYEPDAFAGPTCLILSPSLRTLKLNELEHSYGKPSEVFVVQGMKVIVWPYNISATFPKDTP